MPSKEFYYTEERNKKALLMMKAGLFKPFLQRYYFQ